MKGTRVSIDAPLTYGQLSTWRSIETFARDRLSEVNVPATWDVRGFDAATVHTALQVLVERHESLRTTYHVVAGLPVQRVHRTLVPRIEYLECDGADADAAARTTRQLCQRAFAVTGDPGWHGVLGTVRGRPQFLALSLSHLVVDLWAATELQAQFRGVLTGSAPGCDACPAPRTLAQLQGGDAWAARRRGAEKYWRRLLSEGPVRNLPEQRLGVPQRRIQATLRSHGLAVLVAQAAARNGVSPQSVITAMTAAALGQLVGRDRVMLSIMSANRFDKQWQPLISTMNQLVPLACDVGPDWQLERYLKRVHLNALMSYRHGSYDVDRAAEWAHELATPDGARFEHDCWFNFVTEPGQDRSGHPAAPPAAECRWTPPRRQAGHPFYARVNSDGHSWIEVGLRVDPDLVPPAAAMRALRLIALGVLRSVHDPGSTLAQLRAEAPGELSPTVFPATVDELDDAGQLPAA